MKLPIIFAVLSGLIIGTIQWWINPSFLPRMTPLIGLLLGFGAVLGDMIGSFIKRRMGKNRGTNLFLLDSLDFVIISLLFLNFFFELTTWNVIILLISTPILHRVFNIAGYKLKFKKEPW